MVAVGKHRKLMHIKLIGAQLSLYDQDEILAFMQEAIESREKVTILSGNVHAFNLCYQHPWLRLFYNQASAVRIDGMGVRLGARMIGYATPTRMTWADFAWMLASFASRCKYTLYFLGAKPGIAEKARDRLQKHYPNLKIVGVHHGYFDKSGESEENEFVIAQINAAHPDILIVGFGMPLQEKWLKDNRNKINANVAITGGAVFDYISGELKRAPKWMTDHGLEWLGRLIIEPGRLWQRYLIGNPVFFWRILIHHFFKLPLPE